MPQFATNPVLAIDVGNSRTKFGIFDAATRRDDQLPSCLWDMAVSNELEIPWNDMRDWLGKVHPRDCRVIIAGTRPNAIDRVIDCCPEEWPRATVIDDPSEFPLRVALAEPHKAGIDRLLTAVAANVIRPEDCPVVIIDSGTATTVDLVSAAGVFLGGSILPGLELTAKSLHHYTAKLPYIPIEELAAESHEPLGKSTREALRSGIFWGQLGAIRELTERLSLLTEQPPLVLLCGGGAQLLDPHLPEAKWYPHLALQGLMLVAGRALS